MSLFSSIQIAKNALVATEIGLHVTGNNIANANTPGYIRQQVIYQPAPPQRIGDLVFGLGVEVAGITQASNRFLEDRVRSAISDLAQAETKEGAWLDVENLLGDLNDSNLRTSLTTFFNSIQDVLNQPESIAARNLTVQKGLALSADFHRISDQVDLRRANLNDQVASLGAEINRLTNEVARLNVQIVATEAGDTTSSDAIGLRDQRVAALNKLSELIDIRTYEQDSGSVTVMVGGDFLVADGTQRNVIVAYSSGDEADLASIQIADTRSPLESSGGKLGGLLTARDEILGGFRDELDRLAGTLAFEFNKLYSSGQGLVGYTNLTSEHDVTSTTVALNRAGLPFAPVNGSFQIQVKDKSTGITTTTNIPVALNGFDTDSTLGSIKNALDAVAGVSASITATGQLQISSDASNFEFSFANDSSGALAALGLASFFTGTSASSIGIASQVVSDPSKFAASAGGIGHDTAQAEKLATFLDRGLASQGGTTFAVLYDQMAGEVTQQTATARSIADGFRTFKQTVEGQSLALSGVNIDEEAVRMIMLQRAYQANAKFISTVNELLETLVNM